MKKLTSKSRQNMIEAIKDYQEIQKQNPFGSLPWLQASKEINAIAKILSDDQNG